MALDIFEVLVSFLCPTNEAASSCREFIQNHSSVLPPIGPLFYFLLFPLIFTILFVYIISDKVLFGGQLKWAKVLIGISAFIFIIISGLYPVALVLSEFWYIAIVFLGVFYFLFSHKKGGGGGGGGGKGGPMPVLGGALATPVSIYKSKRKADEKIKLAFEDVSLARRLMQEIDSGKAQRPADNVAQARGCLENIREVILEYELYPEPHVISSIQRLKKATEMIDHLINKNEAVLKKAA